MVNGSNYANINNTWVVPDKDTPNVFPCCSGPTGTPGCPSSSSGDCTLWKLGTSCWQDTNNAKSHFLCCGKETSPGQYTPINISPANASTCTSTSGTIIGGTNIPKNKCTCSGNGVCSKRVCTCDDGYTGGLCGQSSSSKYKCSSDKTCIPAPKNTPSILTYDDDSCGKQCDLTNATVTLSGTRDCVEGELRKPQIFSAKYHVCDLINRKDDHCTKDDWGRCSGGQHCKEEILKKGCEDAKCTWTSYNGKGCNDLNCGLSGPKGMWSCEGKKNNAFILSDNKPTYPKCPLKGLGGDLFPCDKKCETCGWTTTNTSQLNVNAKLPPTVTPDYGFTIDRFSGGGGNWPRECEMCYNPYGDRTLDKWPNAESGEYACAGQFKLTDRNSHACD